MNIWLQRREEIWLEGIVITLPMGGTSSTFVKSSSDGRQGGRNENWAKKKIIQTDTWKKFAKSQNYIYVSDNNITNISE